MSKTAPLVTSLFLLSALSPLAHAADDHTSWHFLFGNQPSANGAIQVTPETTYENAKGYGFEPAAALTAKGDFATASKPFYFSAQVPEGNYNVTVTFGNPDSPANTTIKAELRRLMVEAVHTDAGKTATRTFTVNVRTPDISTGGKVKLKKPREVETEIHNWDDKITLEFDGENPGVSAINIEKTDCPTLYILGDSTVCDQPTEPYASWGQMITRFFKPGLAVSNQAESGESLRSSKGAHRFDKVLSTIKPGDFLLIQYGHNDMKEKGGKKAMDEDYIAIYKKLIEDTKAKGASPVVVTSVSRKSFDNDGRITNSFVNENGDYIQAAKDVAKDENVPMIDLNATSATFYEAIGPKEIQPIFANAHEGTHHGNYGAYEIAKCVLLGIQQDKLDLAKFITDDFHFDPAKPDPIASFDVPPSPAIDNTKPAGN